MKLSLDQNIFFRILIVDSEKQAAEMLSKTLTSLKESSHYLIEKQTVSNVSDAYSSLTIYESNVIFIDINNLGLRDSISFIQHVRIKFPTKVFVLYCEKAELLSNEAEIYNGWGKRLRHYFLLSKNRNNDEFTREVIFNLKRVEFDLYTYGAQESLFKIGNDEIDITEIQFSKLHSQITHLTWQLKELLVKTKTSDNTQQINERHVFVIMSFNHPDINDIYEYGIKNHLMEQFNFLAGHAAETFYTGIGIEKIYDEIHKSNFVIAELSHPISNCYYELGFADALAKPVIRVAKKGTPLPFDASPYNTIFYENIKDLKQQLTIAVTKIKNLIG
jgi:hypothetical protein